MKTMKKKLIFILILLLIPAFAWASGRIVFMSPGTSSCASCTGGLLFAAYFEENANLDITEGEPCGCAASSGDTLWTANDSCVIVEGANGYVDSADAGKYISFDISSDDIVNDSTGSVAIKIETTGFDNGANIIEMYNDYFNQIYLTYYSAADLLFMYRGNNVSKNTITAAAGVATGGTYYIIFRWTNDDVDPNIYLEVFDSDKVSMGSGSNNDNLTALASAPTILKIGNSTVEEGDTHIFGVKIYDTYAGATSGDFSDFDN